MRPFWLTLVLGCAPAVASGQQVELRQSLAARTSLVLAPRASVEIDRDAPEGAKAQVTLGGTAIWIPAMPVVGELSYQKFFGEAGSRTLELGGGWRFFDGLGTGRVAIITGGYRTETHVVTEFVNQTAAARHYRVARAGISSVRFTPSSGGDALALTAFYVGVSRNRLTNTSPGTIANRAVRRTGIDLLIGSAPEGSYGGGSLGMRLFLNRDAGSFLGWGAELGSRPGLGIYGLISIDAWYMFTDMLR
jgi:hypothetical protein